MCVCVGGGYVRYRERGEGHRRLEEEESRTRVDVRHAASMQVSYEKRCVRLQRQAGEDASGSASDARANLTY